MPRSVAQPALSRLEMLGVAQAANILERMGEDECRLVTVDYTTSLGYKVDCLKTPPEGDPKPVTVPVHRLTFVLEDAMFGGEVFAAVTCNGLVIIRPFLWTGYEELAKMKIVVDK